MSILPIRGRTKKAPASKPNADRANKKAGVIAMIPRHGRADNYFQRRLRNQSICPTRGLSHVPKPFLRS